MPRPVTAWTPGAPARRAVAANASISRAPMPWPRKRWSRLMCRWAGKSRVRWAKSRAEVADVGKPLLRGRVLERADEIAGDRVLDPPAPAAAHRCRRADSGRASARGTPVVRGRAGVACALVWRKMASICASRRGGQVGPGWSHDPDLVYHSMPYPSRRCRPASPRYARHTYVAFGANYCTATVVYHIPYCSAHARTSIARARRRS